MSILNENPVTREQRLANELLLTPSKMKKGVLDQLEFWTKCLWNQATPQTTIDAMGNKAVAFFEINEQFAQKLTEFFTLQGDSLGLERLQAIQARIQPYTKNQEDGTVTINQN